MAVAFLHTVLKQCHFIFPTASYVYNMFILSVLAFSTMQLLIYIYFFNQFPLFFQLDFFFCRTSPLNFIQINIFTLSGLRTNHQSEEAISFLHDEIILFLSLFLFSIRSYGILSSHSYSPTCLVFFPNAFKFNPNFFQHG